MNIIDILILAVLGVSLIFGLYRGFISGVLSVAALIGAAAAAFAVSPSLAAWLQGNDTLVNTLMYYTDAGSRIKDLDLSLLTVSQVTQGALTQIMAGAQLPEQFQAAFINAVNTAPGATTMATLLSQTIVNVSLSILSFLICFLGCYIVATFVIHLICYVFELPVLRHLDALMGGVFGLARGGLRADGLPDELQIHAPRAERQQRIRRDRQREQQRHGGQPHHAQIHRQREQQQRADRAHDEISVSCPLRLPAKRNGRPVGQPNRVAFHKRASVMLQGWRESACCQTAAQGATHSKCP